AIALYARILAAGIDQPGQVLKRQAIALGADGRPAQGARLCQQALTDVDEVTRIGLARTGRRLARAAKIGWAPLPPLTRPRTRQLYLEMAPTRDHRPRWRSPDGDTTLEAALVSQLAALGRVAIHAEGLLWRTLFGLLFDDLIFAPVPGMLPTPCRTRPLDLGGPEFVARRQPQVSERLAEIAAGQAPARIAACWAERQGQAIAGVCWARFPLPLLQRVATDLGGAALSAVLSVVAASWRLAPRGLPDLVVLAGPPVRIPGALPGRIPAHALLAEIKGPGDQLSDAQRVWLDRLLRAGVTAELWRVSQGCALQPGG
ncbi:MAG: VRR-NUC domain-containing protein, partial [Oligoflexia bacterium]|nr:VRR-NUC domain-containing protein [Oligoflexia bacterium]